jgi:hypothetical protein
LPIFFLLPRKKYMGGGANHLNLWHGAGVLPFCTDHPTGQIHILLLRETRIDNYTTEIRKAAYIDLGGKRDYLDTDPAYTATREFNEESRGMYQDLSVTILDQIRDHAWPSVELKGRRSYYLFCVAVPYRDVPDSTTMEWVPLRDFLFARGDVFNGVPIAGRLLDLINQKGVRHSLATIG